ncbi:MAG: hypothetical protein ACE5HT_08165 [Gemmatimonadales bacterium]
MYAKIISRIGITLSTVAAIALVARGSVSDTSAASTAVASVHIVNSNSRDLRVYAMSASGLHLLGTVGSHEDAGFSLPHEIASANENILLVAAHMDSHSTYLSQNLKISSGDMVEWNLAGAPRQSDAQITHKLD